MHIPEALHSSEAIPGKTNYIQK